MGSELGSKNACPHEGGSEGCFLLALGKVLRDCSDGFVVKNGRSAEEEGL